MDEVSPLLHHGVARLGEHSIDIIKTIQNNFKIISKHLNINNKIC